ncbi:MAG: hypothetical protein A4E56_03416 [Pelotomaculum sp. PtaU1.Bin065]|nr:MAG: hypothetical protein A4E56_03416 [Pelotomaculum sp. PtaU1.Bin065]
MDVTPALASAARAPPARMTAAGISTASVAIFVSLDSIFLPRYSGVRPTIRPTMNTVRITKTSMPYNPEPAPPKTTSPSIICSIGTRPPTGVRLSCMVLTAPQDAAVVTVAKRAALATPKRTSFPSSVNGPLTPRALTCGLPATSLV